MAVLLSLSALADKFRLPYPVILVVVGIMIGFIPRIPIVTLQPETVFLIFLPPLLYDAASKTSWNDFKKAIRPISTLAITLVFFTTTAVAVAAHSLIPGFSWALGFVLGAIVSPPDAVAATSITKGLGLNKKVITILEGESLVNDASALIAYHYAVAAVTTGVFVFWRAGMQFVWHAVGGVGIGLVTGYLFVFIHKRIHHSSLVETSLTLLTPFVAYLAAEIFHTSGILAVVCTGLFLSRQSNEVFSSLTRMKSKVVWDTLIFLLNGMIFILMGLQLPDILGKLDKYSMVQLIKYSSIISLVVISVRILWVFGGAFGQKLLGGPSIGNDFYSEQDKSLWKNVLIVSWTGTRGIVSLATALALPTVMGDGNSFPSRPLILFLAFVVIFMTLIVQGLSLPLLLQVLNVKKLEHSNLEGKELRLTVAESTIHFIETTFPIDLAPPVESNIKNHYEEISRRLRKELEAVGDLEKRDPDSQNLLLSDLIAAQVEILKFQRSLLIKFQKENRFSDEVLKRLENELDIEDLRLNTLLQNAKQS